MPKFPHYERFCRDPVGAALLPKRFVFDGIDTPKTAEVPKPEKLPDAPADAASTPALEAEKAALEKQLIADIDEAHGLALQLGTLQGKEADDAKTKINELTAKARGILDANEFDKKWEDEYTDRIENIEVEMFEQAKGFEKLMMAFPMFLRFTSGYESATDNPEDINGKVGFFAFVQRFFKKFMSAMKGDFNLDEDSVAEGKKKGEGDKAAADKKAEAEKKEEEKKPTTGRDLSEQERSNLNGDLSQYKNIKTYALDRSDPLVLFDQVSGGQQWAIGVTSMTLWKRSGVNWEEVKTDENMTVPGYLKKNQRALDSLTRFVDASGIGRSSDKAKIAASLLNYEKIRTDRNPPNIMAGFSENIDRLNSLNGSSRDQMIFNLLDNPREVHRFLYEREEVKQERLTESVANLLTITQIEVKRNSPDVVFKLQNGSEYTYSCRYGSLSRIEEKKGEAVKYHRIDDPMMISAVVPQYVESHREQLRAIAGRLAYQDESVNMATAVKAMWEAQQGRDFDVADAFIKNWKTVELLAGPPRVVYELGDNAVRDVTGYWIVNNPKKAVDLLLGQIPAPGKRKEELS
ncbi:MAG: hypothetical protein Q8P95_00790 [bacterium]|nr:hypothetical protein [bacterium]